MYSSGLRRDHRKDGLGPVTLKARLIGQWPPDWSDKHGGNRDDRPPRLRTSNPQLPNRVYPYGTSRLLAKHQQNQDGSCQRETSST